jgi:hypothetical protein
MKNFGKTVLLTVLHVGALFGPAIYLLQSRYDLYQQVTDVASENELLNRLTATAIIILILGLYAGLYVMKAAFYSADIGWKKKAFWGIQSALPYGLALLFANWINANIEFVMTMMSAMAVSNLLAWFVAPEFILNMKDGRKV